jgi:hypothetical protein
MKSNPAEQVIDGKVKIDIKQFQHEELYEFDSISSGRRVMEANEQNVLVQDLIYCG